MYDTIHAERHYITPHEREQIAARLQGVKIIRDLHGRQTIRGMHRNFIASLSSDRLYLQGSLSRFADPQGRQFLLSWMGTRDAVQALSESLNVDVRSAELTRVDVACDLSMRHPVREYLAVMRECGGLRREEVGRTTLRYAGAGLTICLYDKRAELESKKKSTDYLQAQHVLRAEIRCSGLYLQDILQRTDGTLSALYDGRTYALFTQMWMHNLIKIAMKRDVLMPSGAIGKKEIYGYCLARTIAEMGEDKFFDELLSNTSRKQRSKIKIAASEAIEQYLSPSSKGEEFKQAVESKRTTIIDEYITEEEAMHEEHQQ